MESVVAVPNREIVLVPPPPHKSANVMVPYPHYGAQVSSPEA